MFDMLLLLIVLSALLLALGVDFAALFGWLMSLWRGRGYGTRHYI
jgi:hypothetical protein